MAKIDKNWLASIGITAEDLEKAAQPEATEKGVAAREQANREAICVLRGLTWPYDEYVSVKCWECGQFFLTNYKANVYCSQQCFKDGLAKLGIKWRPNRTLSEQWGTYEPPLHIPPGAIAAMRRLIDLVDQGMIQELHSQEQDSSEELLIPEPEPLPDLPSLSNDPDIQLEFQGEEAGFLSILDVPLE